MKRFGEPEPYDVVALKDPYEFDLDIDPPSS
jgi:hypothetical protein